MAKWRALYGLLPFLIVFVSACARTPAELTVKISELSSPVQPGAEARLAVETLPGAECEVAVRYASGPSRAEGLEAKEADRDGRVEWAWIVGTNTTPGTWPVVVTCTHEGQTAATESELTVGTEWQGD